MKTHPIRIMAIDPSINMCGYSVFYGKKLIDYGLLNPEKSVGSEYLAKSRSIAGQIDALFAKHKVERLILEVPEHFGASGYMARESGSIFKLTFLCGMICCNQYVETTPPRGWKKQMPKEVVFNRMNHHGMYPDIDFKKIDHNIADAISIGHWAIYGKI